MRIAFRDSSLCGKGSYTDKKIRTLTWEWDVKRYKSIKNNIISSTPLIGSASGRVFSYWVLHGRALHLLTMQNYGCFLNFLLISSAIAWESSTIDSAAGWGTPFIGSAAGLGLLLLGLLQGGVFFVSSYRSAATRGGGQLILHGFLRGEFLLLLALLKGGGPLIGSAEGWGSSYWLCWRAGVLLLALLKGGGGPLIGSAEGWGSSHSDIPSLAGQEWSLGQNCFQIMINSISFMARK
jgi:hypothetical protein